MYSALVLIEAGKNGVPSSEAVVRTLAALVPAAIEGVVRDVALAVRQPSDDVVRIADHAGCALVTGEADLLRRSLDALKEPRLVVLRAGRVPERAFVGELADLAAYRASACALLLDAPDGWLTRLAPGLSRPSGVVAPRSLLRPEADGVRGLARALPSPAILKARMIGDA
jgi:hypothetical protein